MLRSRRRRRLEARGRSACLPAVGRRLAAAFLLFLAQPAHAWFDAGHQAIAAAAFFQLDPEARDKVARLLALHPDYPSWTAGVAEGERAKIAFIRASTWADDIKRRPDFWKNSLSDDGAHATDNIGYGDRRSHPYWHYMDLSFSRDDSPTTAAPEPNALTQIRVFSKTLGSDASDEVKSYDLVWLEHLVADVHQPLHATSRFSKRLPKGDSGGNLELICLSFICGLKLHAFWDSLLGQSSEPADALELAGQLPGPDPDRAGELEPRVWFEESAALAQAVVYTKAIGDGEGPFELDQAYQAEAREIARVQAAVAAARLAGVINEALAK
ncbi:S1/P1 nuclease [Rhodoblastus acidophilus]|uniref:S1/P1 nuclease n=1 Tax=Rhodoblastus acidophilus TaxID=1074 RepID=A0A6N8DKN5_RHOAC|nr:S1/P1 nuclease [Rhodoblastus acidophilus]